MKFLWLVVVALIGVVGVVAYQVRADRQRPLSAQPQTSMTPATVPQMLPQQTAPSVTPQTWQAVEQQQAQAQTVVAERNVILPLEGKILSRPEFVSAMEWDMLQAVAKQQPNPELELTRLVNTLRFHKMFEHWQQLADTKREPAVRSALAKQLLLELNGRKQHQELSENEFLQLQDQLRPDANR